MRNHVIKKKVIFQIIFCMIFIFMLFMPLLGFIALHQEIETLQAELKMLKEDQSKLNFNQKQLTDAVTNFINMWQVDVFQSSAYAPLDNKRGLCADEDPEFMSTMEDTEENINIAIAVDPSVISYYSPVWIQGVGWRKALDTGGAITGKKIDICMQTFDEAVNYGRKEVIVVWPKQL